MFLGKTGFGHGLTVAAQTVSGNVRTVSSCESFWSCADASQRRVWTPPRRPPVFPVPLLSGNVSSIHFAACHRPAHAQNPCRSKFLSRRRPRDTNHQGSCGKIPPASSDRYSARLFEREDARRVCGIQRLRVVRARVHPSLSFL